MQLMPRWFRPPCSSPVIWKPRPLTPIVTSLAGALWTPRVPSVRAQTPATCPDGGTSSGRFVIGSMTSIHG